MDDQRICRIVRTLRRRLGWRQTDLARRARCSQRTVSRAESGHLPAVPMLRRILSALDASLVIEVRWRAGALDRLLDEDHAHLVAMVTELLSRWGWDVKVEVTYSSYGERGSIDILAFEPTTGTLLVIEVKTDIAAVESTLRKIDEKVRLGPVVARERFGWQPAAVGWLLVMPESSTLRRRVDRHAAVFNRVFPMRGSAVRSALRRPAGAMAGLWFLSVSHAATRIRGGGGRERVRKHRISSLSHPAAARVAEGATPSQSDGPHLDKSHPVAG